MHIIQSELPQKHETTPQLVFPARFVLPDLLGIISPVFSYGVIDHDIQVAAGDEAARWYRSHRPASNERITKFLEHGNFARFGGMIHVHADYEHFLTAMMFYLWSFSADDAWDNGGLTDDMSMDDIDREVAAFGRAVDGRVATDLETAHTAMLRDLVVRMRRTASPSCMRRFAKAVKGWSGAVAEQSRRRTVKTLPTIAEFMTLRRRTIGQYMEEGILEYSIDGVIPSRVFKHPTVKAMSEAACDVLTWPNDLISFNKEQADGDYQNFVCIIMHERGLDLQEAVDVLTMMIADRVRDYAAAKRALPSFGSQIDQQLSRYLTELEHEVHASVRWFYESKRYWRSDLPPLCQDLEVVLYPREA